MILQALVELSLGNDVTIVAITHDDARKIGRRVCSLAKALEIPCGSIPEQDGPKVKARAYDGDIPLPTPRTKVFLDHSCQHERTNVREPAYRTVMT